jgi:hypothetical protein
MVLREVGETVLGKVVDDPLGLLTPTKFGIRPRQTGEEWSVTVEVFQDLDELAVAPLGHADGGESAVVVHHPVRLAGECSCAECFFDETFSLVE